MDYWKGKVFFLHIGFFYNLQRWGKTPVIISDEMKSNIEKKYVKGRETIEQVLEGHLYGENKIVVSDTLYCNFNDKGERTGKWILKAKDITVAEYSAYNENVLDCYKMDILGQKTPYENFLFHNTSVLKLVLFKDKIQYIPNTLRESRPELPSLCKIKYGYREATRPIIE